MAEWENVPLDPKKKKKQRVNLEPRRPMAARLKKKQRVNLEPPRPMAARLKKEDLLDLITALLKFKSSLSTTVAAQCRFQSSP